MHLLSLDDVTSSAIDGRAFLRRRQLAAQTPRLRTETERQALRHLLRRDNLEVVHHAAEREDEEDDEDGRGGGVTGCRRRADDGGVRLGGQPVDALARGVRLCNSNSNGSAPQLMPKIGAMFCSRVLPRRGPVLSPAASPAQPAPASCRTSPRRAPIRSSPSGRPRRCLWIRRRGGHRRSPAPIVRRFGQTSQCALRSTATAGTKPRRQQTRQTGPAGPIA